MPGPSLKKATPRLVATRTSARARLDPAALHRWLAHADVVSEGAVMHDGPARTWFGSTSVVLRTPAGEGCAPATLLALASRDVHVRARMLRLARTEAQSRAPAFLDRASMDLTMAATADGLRIDVDVQAALIERRRAERLA